MLSAKRAGFLLAIFLVTGGCAAGTSRPEEGTLAWEPCKGQLILVVKNRTGAELEITESRRYSGARTVIAVVGTGTHELVIRDQPGMSYGARLPGGELTVATTNRSRVRDRRNVTFARECRVAGGGRKSR